VLWLVADGATNPVAVAKLLISETGVKTQISLAGVSIRAPSTVIRRHALKPG
jgi:hypothetical protein